MRHRLRVSLYDEYTVDAQLLDYLEQLPTSHRGDYLQRLLRVGHMVLAGVCDPDEALLKASLPELKDASIERPAKTPPPLPRPEKPVSPKVLEDGPAESALQSLPVPQPAPSPEPLNEHDALQEISIAQESRAPQTTLSEPIKTNLNPPASTPMDTLARLRARALQQPSEGGDS